MTVMMTMMTKLQAVRSYQHQQLLLYLPVSHLHLLQERLQQPASRDPVQLLPLPVDALLPAALNQVVPLARRPLPHKPHWLPARLQLRPLWLFHQPHPVLQHQVKEIDWLIELKVFCPSRRRPSRVANLLASTEKRWRRNNLSVQICSVRLRVVILFLWLFVHFHVPGTIFFQNTDVLMGTKISSCWINSLWVYPRPIFSRPRVHQQLFAAPVLSNKVNLCVVSCFYRATLF